MRLPRIPRIRSPKPMDIIRVNGKLHAVVQIDSRHGETIEPLGNVLARHLLVGEARDPLTLQDALIDAGWTPPAT